MGSLISNSNLVKTRNRKDLREWYQESNTIHSLIIWISVSLHAWNHSSCVSLASSLLEEKHRILWTMVSIKDDDSI